MKRYARTMWCFVFGVAAGSLQASEVQFLYPTDGTHRIDICLQWGMQCAGEAANVYCQARGFDGAIASEIEQDIGAAHPTVVIGSGQVCAEAHCDGYYSITCAKEDAWTQSTGQGGLVVEAVAQGSRDSTEGVMLVAVSEVDEHTSAAGVVNSTGFAFLDVPPGKHRLFVLDWKNAPPVRPQPGMAVDVPPGKEGLFVTLTVD